MLMKSINETLTRSIELGSVEYLVEFDMQGGF